MTRREFLLLSALGPGLAVIPGTESRAAPAPGRAKNTLTIGVGRDFLDGADSRTFLHGSTHTWEALTGLDGGLRARPWLAESWKSADGGRRWHFTLRSPVRFHDGSPLTVQAAAASLRRLQTRPKYDPSGTYRSVEAIETRGERELIFRLNEPSPAFPNLLAYYSSPIIKPEFFDAQGRIIRLVATGPFRVDRLKRGDRIELEGFPEYWGVKPKFEKVIFRTLLDAQSRLLSLQTGEIEAVSDVGGILPEQADSLSHLPEISLKRQEVATTHYLFFNGRRFPLDRPAARCWVAGLVDRSAWISALTRGGGRVARDFFTPLAREWSFGSLAPPPGRKPVPDRRPWVILIHNGTLQRWPYLELAQLLQDRLGREGFPARLQVLEAGPYQESLKKGAFDLVLQPNTLMTGDPDFFYSYYFHSRGPYRWGYDSPELDHRIEGARREMDLQRRRGAYRDLGERLNRDLPVLPLYHDLSLFAVRRSVRNLEMDAFFRPSLVEAGPAEAPGVGRG